MPYGMDWDEYKPDGYSGFGSYERVSPAKEEPMPAPDPRDEVIRGLCEAIEAEADALNLYLATAPDRGGPNGLKGQRQKAWENAHAAMIAALAGARKLGVG